MPTSLREARLALGLSPHELAARAGVADATVYRTERGATRPTPAVARRLADALGLPAAEVAELAAAVEQPVVTPTPEATRRRKLRRAYERVVSECSGALAALLVVEHASAGTL